jgi:hypothetical protein
MTDRSGWKPIELSSEAHEWLLGVCFRNRDTTPPEIAEHAKAVRNHVSKLEWELGSLQNMIDELEADFHKPVFSPWFLDKHGTAHREALFGPSFIAVHPDGSYHARIYKADGDVVDEQKPPELDQSWSMYLADACAWWAGWRVPEKWSKDRGACDVAQLPVRSPKLPRVEWAAISDAVE